MRDPLSEGTSQVADPSPSERLDSWKEIAAYFRRDVRTVRRWEQSLGLPVHRHRQERGVAVYAYKWEVDAWWRGRDETAEAPPAAVPAPPKRRLSPAVWAAISSLVTLAILLGVWRGGPHADPTDAAAPLTSYPGSEEYPSLSPDGARLAFAWNGTDGRNFDIYAKPLDTSLADPVRLTTDPAPDFSPAWSPDGRSIGFVRQTGPEQLKVMIVPAEGGIEREVATARVPWERAIGSYLAWTPDGNGLVYLDRESPDEPAGLFLISLESLESRRLTSPPHGSWGDSSPAFSPDGDALAFERLKTIAVSDIFVAPLDADWNPAAEPRRVTTSAQGATNPLWTGGGKQILFAADKGGEPRIQRVSASGSGQPTEVTPDSVLPVFAMAASKLVFSRGTFDTNVWRIDLRSTRSVRAGGESLVASTRTDSFADYSPRGDSIVYISDRSGSPELWISDRDGANSRQASAFGGPIIAAPRWSPDGGSIAFAMWQDGSADIYTMHEAGGAATPLTADPAEDLYPSWSRDGRWIYFSSNRSGDWQIWKKPAGGGAAVQVTQSGGAAALESPDGRFLYFTKGRGAPSLWKMPSAGGAERLLAENLFGTANFSASNDGVYFLARPKANAGTAPCDECRLQFLNFATGKVERLATIDQAADFGLTVSEDGRHVLYTRWDQLESDLFLQTIPDE